MERHIPPTGQSMIHHSTKDCECSPKRVVVTKQQTTGRSGHGGYKVVRTDYFHNDIPSKPHVVSTAAVSPFGKKTP